jgi:hypothetical protein
VTVIDVLSVVIIFFVDAIVSFSTAVQLEHPQSSLLTRAIGWTQAMEGNFWGQLNLTGTIRSQRRLTYSQTYHHTSMGPHPNGVARPNPK